MEEDETLVLKNTGLYSHLLEAGFEDFEVIEEEKSSFSSPPVFNNSNEVRQNRSLLDDEDYEKIIYTILDSRLVFNDDVLFVKNFVVHMKPLLTERFSLRHILCSNVTIQTLAVTSGCVACTARGVKLKPWVFVSLHLIPISFHSVKHVYTVFRKRKRRKILDKLLNSLKKLSLLMQKAIQFINEHEVLAYNSFEKSSPLFKGINAYVGEQQAMYHLRLSTFHAIRSAILDFKTLIIMLVNNFPLKNHVDSLSFHLAFLDEMDLHCSYSTDMTITVKQLQSELLRQLTLCFIPSLWVCNTDTLLKNIFIILSDLDHKFLRRYEQLKSIFEVYYTCEKDDVEISSKSTDPKWVYKEAYVKLCSVSLNLHTILKNSRHMEEYLEETHSSHVSYENVVHNMDMMSEHMKRDYDQCKVAFDDFHKYIQSLKPKVSTDSVKSDDMKEETKCIKTNVTVGVTDFNTAVSDEVFVGVSDAIEENYENETVIAESAERGQCSKILINELKIALQNKAKEFKEREKIALLSKNIEVDDEELLMFVKKTDRDGSSSEEELISIRESECSTSGYKFQPIQTGESQFTKQIAQASAAFNVKVEQFGEQDEDDE